MEGGVGNSCHLLAAVTPLTWFSLNLHLSHVVPLHEQCATAWRVPVAVFLVTPLWCYFEGRYLKKNMLPIILRFETNYNHKTLLMFWHVQWLRAIRTIKYLFMEFCDFLRPFIRHAGTPSGISTRFTVNNLHDKNQLHIRFEALSTVHTPEFYLLIDVLPEIHLLRKTLATVFEINTKEHLICELLFGLCKTHIQLVSQKHAKVK